MKKYLLFAILGATAFTAKAQQLTTQRWEATISIPSPTDCYLQFDHDTMNLFMKDMPSAPLESMHFTSSNDTLTLVKLTGNSPCGTEQAVYITTIKDNQLQFSKVSDACDVRINAFLETPWKPYVAGGSQ